MPEGSSLSDLVIDVFADPICPWCYIGHRRLIRALAHVGAGATRVRHRAYQLNPAMTETGMDRQAYLSAKFGGADRAQRIYDAIRREGEAEGIAFAFSRIRRTPNTVAAHRLIRHAERLGHADGVLDGLFRAYFIEGRDIGDPAELAAVATAAGCDGDEAARFIATNEDRDQVLAEDAAARAAGIGGVPHFIVGGRWQLPGAQSPEVIARAVELARAAAAPVNATPRDG